jgi:D-alanine-D-alanine ligase
MKGFSRTEFIIVDNEPFMLEMNTVGSDVRKLLPQQSIAAGISLEDLFKRYRISFGQITNNFINFV